MYIYFKEIITYYYPVNTAIDLKNIFKIFYQPYSCDLSHSKKGELTFFISLFVFLFLFSFAPFGINEMNSTDRFFITFGYGVTCAAALAVNYYLIMSCFSSFFKDSDWTVGKQILWTVWILFTISIFNSIYTTFVKPSPLSLFQLTASMLQVTLVGVFPVSAIIVFDYLRLYKKHAKQAKLLKDKINTQPLLDESSLTLTGTTNNELLQLQANEFLYMASADNYVEITYQFHSGLKKKLLRGTLKRFEKELDNPAILRCHRSYIVNLSKVLKVSGNAQGYTLTLRNNNLSIPVSRSYADQVLSRIHQL